MGNFSEVELQKISDGFAALARFHKIFGFARLFHCVDGWYVSNKTDEGIGGGGPGLSMYGETPQEALFALVRFLEDPKVPASIPCQKCGEDAPCDDFTFNSTRGSRDIDFTCPHCWEMMWAREICPLCMGKLEDLPDTPGFDPTWHEKCSKCGEIVLRGDGEEYPKFEMKTLDLVALGAWNDE